MGKRIYALILSTLVFLLISSNLIGQVIQGKLIDSSDERPLAYVNVGVVNISRGTITNEQGEYDLNCTELPQDAKVRLSMIGYESQTFSVQELLTGFKTIRLVKKAIELEEVAVTWSGSIRQIGAFKVSKTGGVCG